MNILTITFTEETSNTGIKLMSSAYQNGWETLEPLMYFDCGHYSTTLYKKSS